MALLPVQDLDTHERDGRKVSPEEEEEKRFQMEADSLCSHLSPPRQAAAASFPRRYLLFVL